MVPSTTMYVKVVVSLDEKSSFQMLHNDFLSLDFVLINQFSTRDLSLEAR